MTASIVAMSRAYLLLLLPILAGMPRPADAAPPPGWDYVVTLDETLSRAEVTCCFTRYRPRRMVLGNPTVLPALGFPRTPGAPFLRAPDAGGNVVPEGLAPGRSCVRYTLDLEAMASLSAGRRPALRRVGRDLLLAPRALLLRPYLWPLRARVTVRFVLPEGLHALVPWPAAGTADTYTLDPQSLNLMARIGVGRFEVRRQRVAGADVEIALLDAPLRAGLEAVDGWVRAAVEAVGGLYGRFPTAKLAVLVQPAPARRPAVVFGMAMRGGGGHVLLYPASAAPPEALPGEWVAVHELVHLGLPWTPEEDAWLQEGFATYYQEVLRARAGMFAPRQAWQHIEEGFGRGRRVGGRRALALESRDMGREHTYHRVYWAGAAMALRIDVALRRSTGGKRSLDDVMRWWWRHRGMEGAPHAGLDLLRDAGQALGTPAPLRIARALLASSDFPATADLYEALGVRVEAGEVELDDEAPLASIRRAIMTAP